MKPTAPSLHTDLCLLAGLDLEAAGTITGIRKRRDPGFRDRVLMAYEYCCAFCSYDGWPDGAVVGRTRRTCAGRHTPSTYQPKSSTADVRRGNLAE
nr:hypothetical protein [Nonomuraea indica]